MARKIKQADLEKMTGKGWVVDSQSREFMEWKRLVETLDKSASAMVQSSGAAAKSIRTLDTVVDTISKIETVASKSLNNSNSIIDFLNVPKVTDVQPVKVMNIQDAIREPVVSVEPKTWSFKIKRDDRNLITEIIAEEIQVS